jgi:hypothetical protein
MVAQIESRCRLVHRFTGMAASPLTSLVRPWSAVNLVRDLDAVRHEEAVVSTRHGLACLARLSNLALRISTHLHRHHVRLSAPTSSQAGECRHTGSPVHSVIERADLASSPSLQDSTTRRAKSTAGGISPNILSSLKNTKPVCLPTPKQAN